MRNRSLGELRGGWHTWMIIAFFALIGSLTEAQPQKTEKDAEGGDLDVASEAAPAIAETAAHPGSGLRVYIDPETGALTTPPAGERRFDSVELLQAMDTSHEGLEERPSPVPGGGMIVDLKGRFQSTVFATLDSDGNASITHTPPADLAAKAVKKSGALESQEEGASDENH